MTDEIRTLLADDHGPTRDDVRALLDGHPRFSVCGAVADAPGAVTAALAEQPRLAVLDVRMPGSGIAAAWEIARRLPRTTIVMLTISETDGDLFSALRAGADAYLLKDMRRDEVPVSLARIVDEGVAELPGRLLKRVFEDFRDRDPHRRAVFADPATPPLTSREWQVLDLLRAGRDTAHIARVLHVSKTTVRTHVMTLCRKLEVDGRDALLALFAGE